MPVQSPSRSLARIDATLRVFSRELRTAGLVEREAARLQIDRLLERRFRLTSMEREEA